MDGPHRSLPMRPRWKKVAEYADNVSFTPEEVGDAIVVAVEQDCRMEVSSGLIDRIRDVLGGAQLFSEDTVGQLENLKQVTGGYPLSGVLLDFVIQATINGKSGEAALHEGMTNALTDRAARCARQVEEHYFRESSLPRSQNVRNGIEEGIRGSDFNRLANHLLNPGSQPAPRRTKQDRLDDGVKL